MCVTKHYFFGSATILQFLPLTTSIFHLPTCHTSFKMIILSSFEFNNFYVVYFGFYISICVWSIYSKQWQIIKMT